MFAKTKPFSILLLLIYSYFCYLMLWISMQYIPLEFDVAFLRIKQEEMQLWYYPTAFFIHVYTAILVLLAGFTQFSKSIRLQYPKVHRYVGYVYIIAILFLAGPSGLVLAIHANGGWTSQLGFSLLGIFWLYFTWKAFVEIKKGNVLAHQKFMYRSFALTLSAITLRAWKYILVALFHPKPMDVYRMVAWLAWVLNLIIAEYLIFIYLNKNQSIKS